MPGRGQGRGGRGRSRSRGRPRKSPAPPSVPLPQSSDDEESTDSSNTSDKTEHTKNYTSDASLNNFIDEMDENLAEVKQSATSNNNRNVLKDSSTQATISTKQKSSSTSTRSKSTTSKDTNNPHSAQTKLNQFLSQPNNMPHQDRMQELQEIAAAKAAKRLEKAKANSQKKRLKLRLNLNLISLRIILTMIFNLLMKLITISEVKQNKKHKKRVLLHHPIIMIPSRKFPICQKPNVDNISKFNVPTVHTLE